MMHNAATERVENWPGFKSYEFFVALRQSLFSFSSLLEGGILCYGYAILRNAFLRRGEKRHNNYHLYAAFKTRAPEGIPEYSLRKSTQFHFNIHKFNNSVNPVLGVYTLLLHYNLHIILLSCNIFRSIYFMQTNVMFAIVIL